LVNLINMKRKLLGSMSLMRAIWNNLMYKQVQVCPVSRI
jgi:hypothetical protein